MHSVPKKYFIILSIVAVVCFFLYSLLPFLSGGLFNSPDENANFIFSKTFAETSSFKISEPLNAEVNGILAPRSMRGDGVSIVPAGFLGLPLLYGSIAKIIGAGAVPFLTPLFAAIGLFFFYGLLRRVFPDRVAFLSTLLLAVHPSFWYYASRSMMHNVLFFIFFIAGLYFFTFSREQARRRHYFFGGLFLAASLAIRSSEAIWIGLIFLFLGYAYAREIRWFYLPWALFGALIAGAPLFFWNALTFGSPFAFGYAGLDAGGESTAGLGGIFGNVFEKIFPFGLDIKNILRASFNYFLVIFPWHAIGVFLGGLVFLRHFFRWEKKHFVYAIAFLILSAWLVVFYGSWDFHDNPTPGVVSIGTSYVRYFLPIYAFSLPFVVLFIFEVAGIFSSVWMKRIIVCAFLLVFVFFSVRITLWRTDESVFSVAKTLKTYGETKETILNVTEADAVVIAANLDKILFPDRRVIFDITYPVVQEYLPLLVNKIPVYFYSRLPERDIEYLNTKKFAPRGIRLESFLPLSAEEELMKIESIEK